MKKQDLLFGEVQPPDPPKPTDGEDGIEEVIHLRESKTMNLIIIVLFIVIYLLNWWIIFLLLNSFTFLSNISAFLGVVTFLCLIPLLAFTFSPIILLLLNRKRKEKAND